MNDRAAQLWQAYPDDPDSLDAAEALFFAATEADTDYAVPWNNLANLRRARGKLTAAETWLREAVGKRPDYWIALTNLALVLEDQSMLLRGEGKTTEADRKIVEAKALYRRAIETDTTSVYARNNLGYLYVQTGETDKALPLLNDAIKRFPGEAALYKNRGLAYLDQEVPVMAAKDFQKAAALDPQYLQRIAVAAEKSDAAIARALWEALATRPELRERADEALKRLGTG
jgi:tetratricopeptide (TPR) repeat protein